jgi:hypothetical protein
MRRFAIGLFFVLHGLAHAAAGMAAQDVPGGVEVAFGFGVRVVLATTLFAIATPGFVAAGFGTWGVVGLERWWRVAARSAAVASALLLILFPRGLVDTAIGLAFDVLALLIARTHVPLKSGSLAPVLRSES